MSVSSSRLMLYVAEELEDSLFKLGESSVSEHLDLLVDQAELQILPLKPENFFKQADNLSHPEDLNLFFVPSQWMDSFKRSSIPESILSKIEKGVLKIAVLGPMKGHRLWDFSHFPGSFIPSGFSESFSAALVRQFLFAALPGLSAFFEKDTQLISDISATDADIGSKLDRITEHFDLHGLFKNKSQRLEFRWKFLRILNVFAPFLGKDQRISMEFAAHESIFGFSVKWTLGERHELGDFCSFLNDPQDSPFSHFTLLQEIHERQELCLSFLLDAKTEQSFEPPLSKDYLSNQKLETMKSLGLFTEPGMIDYYTIRTLPKLWRPPDQDASEERSDLENEKNNLLLQRDQFSPGAFIDRLLTLIDRYKERISTLNRKFGVVSQEKRNSDRKVSQLQHKLKNIQKEKRNLGLSAGNLEERPEQLKKRIKKLEMDNKELSKKLEDRDSRLEDYERNLSEYEKFKAKSKKGNQAA